MMCVISKDDGFTVLELLVSLALMALITAHLSGALYQSRRVTEVQARVSDRLERQFIRQYLTGSLANAQSAFEVGGGPAVLAFDGETDALFFIAVNDSRLDRGGLYRHRVELRDGEDGRSLALSRSLFRSSGSGAGQTETRTLLDGLDGVQLRYFGTLAGEREAAWHETWQGQKSLPKLIELNVSYRDPRRKALPPLIVRIAAVN